MLEDAIHLLMRLVAVPSLSRQEGATADLLQQWLLDRGVDAVRVGNNVYAVAPGYDPERLTVLLDAHHDTVKPSPSYTRDPFAPCREDGRIYGLGSNDDGASLVSMVALFCSLDFSTLPFNVILSLSAEEEVSGEGGLRLSLPHMHEQGYKVDMAIVGEPTSLQPAIAERGLIVLDCVARGVTGHAARNEGVNALYKAVDDIERLRAMRFDKVSPTLGDIKLTVTQIEAGRQHNVVPEECRFVVDVRTTDAYSNEETERMIAAALDSDVKARSYRIHASALDADHPLMRAVLAMGMTPYVSPTTSDMAVLPHIPSLKIGPGNSARSHTADEYVLESEIAAGIETYRALLRELGRIL